MSKALPVPRVRKVLTASKVRRVKLVLRVLKVSKAQLAKVLPRR